jgi:hypothetical protein
MAATLFGVAAAAAIVTAAGISVSSKPFTATISPATFVPGGSGTWHYTIKDADHNGVPSSQALGSAHISIPPGWTVTSVSAAGPPGTAWNAVVNTSANPAQIELGANTQSDRLAGGGALDVTIQASAGCGAASPSVWPIVVKQSNQFLGNGNDFFLDGSTPALTASGSSGPLGSFNVTTSPSPATAGAPITVTARAIDTCGNPKLDYVGPAGLAPTGNFSASSIAPAGDTVDPSYGQFGQWTSGSATATVIAKKAETGRTVTVTADSATGTSLPFNVVPGTLYPSFVNQPGDAQVSSTIYSDVVAQTPVTVAVADVYGNLAPDGTNVSMTATAALKGTNPEPTSGGTATFGDLSIGTINTYQLTAQVGDQSATSNAFEVVFNLAICDGKNSCNSPASNGKQSANSTITSASGTTFQGGVVLESSFIASANKCASFNQIPGTVGTEVKVRSSGNLSTSQPTFTITFTVPKATLKAAHLDNLGASQFNVCLGAKRLDGNSGAWTDASGHPAVFDPQTGFYWGIVPGASNSLPAGNPYIASQHKDGAGNLVIVLVKPYPWDGWGYV